MTRFTLILVGYDDAGGDTWTVIAPRIPVVGETVIGPDDFGSWRVTSVHYRYSDGFAFEPTVEVRARKRDD